MSASGPKLGRGCSRRPQFQATSTPIPAAKQIVLATGRDRLLEAAQLGGEIVASPEDGYGYASGLKPQESRVPLRRCPAGAEARRLDEDEGRRLPGEGAVEKRIGEPGVQRLR